MVLSWRNVISKFCKVTTGLPLVILVRFADRAPNNVSMHSKLMLVLLVKNHFFHILIKHVINNCLKYRNIKFYYIIVIKFVLASAKCGVTSKHHKVTTERWSHCQSMLLCKFFVIDCDS